MSGERLRAVVLIASTVAFSWLAMQAVHEAGHVLHAALSGGRVVRVVLHPLAISRTDVEPNPHPLFVVWGGPLWGCLLPGLGWAASRRLRLDWEYLARFFAGFCLIANGGYLAGGAVYPVGDAAEMLRLETPAWLLIVFGAATISSGLWLWNGLGRRFGLGASATSGPRRHAVAMTLLTVVIVVLELLFAHE